MSKTIAQQIKWDFKTNGNLAIRDKNNKLIYLELSNGHWGKWKYDSQGNEIYWGDSNRNWEKKECDSQGSVIYYENSDGTIIDDRPKSCENKEIVIGGEKFKLVKV